MKFFFSLLIILQSCTFVLSQILIEDKHYPKDTIAFELTDQNNISIETIINRSDTLDLMLHTDIHSVSLIPESSKILADKKNSKSSMAKSWTGSREVNYLEDNALKIDHLEWNDITIWLDMLSGKDTDGKFGLNLFGDRLIEINYDKNHIVLHQRNKGSINLDSYKKFKLSTNDNNSLFVEGELVFGNQKIKNKFLIHSGYGGSIILDDQFCQENKIIHSQKVLEKNELKDSFGNAILTKKVLSDRLIICGTQFAHVPISYFDSDLEIQKTSVLGGELLKRFNLILDIKNLNLYVAANKFTTLKFKTS